MRYIQNVNTYFAIFSKLFWKGCDTMTIKDRIKDLCVKNGITVNKLETSLGFGTGYISKLDKSTPNTKKIQLISDFFNVSVDYIMTGKENQFTIEMADMDADLIMLEKRIKEYAIKLSKLSEEDREDIMKMIDRFGK